jgi:hypothetical protein
MVREGIEMTETRQLLVCADVNLLGEKLYTVSSVIAGSAFWNRMQDRGTT